MNFQSSNQLHLDTIEIYEFCQPLPQLEFKAPWAVLWHACIISLESSVPSRPIIELYNIAHTKGCTWSDSAWKAVEGETVGITIF